MDFSIRVITPPRRPARWPVPVMVIVVIVVTMVAAWLGYLPPQWIALAVGTGVAAVRATLPAPQDVPEIGA